MQWADRERRLSQESSAEPGRWDTSRVEVARGPMLAVSDPEVRVVTVMACTQLLKTELINNTVGYFIDQEPSPIIVIQPTLTMAEAWSADRLTPMLRDTPCLRGKVSDPRSRDGQNKILYKKFPGGYIAMAGANSEASLASRPVRIVLCDEIDKYPPSAGEEGDPISLVEERATTFPGSKFIRVCSPTIEGVSRIAASYADSDQRQFFVACPHCGERQSLKWEQVRWDEGRPATAAYHCGHCGVSWSEAERLAAIPGGRWRQTATFTCCDEEQQPSAWDDDGRSLCRHCGERSPFDGHAGFHVNKLASPWDADSIPRLARKWLTANRGGEEKRKTFINTQLAETFKLRGEMPDWQRLYDRREDYREGTAPAGVLFLTAGVDVQKDRIEVSVWGWGRGKESWLVEHRVLEGDTSRREVWAMLTGMVGESWSHASGAPLPLSRVAIDSGYATQEVYAWARPQRPGLAMVVKGVERALAIVGMPTAVDVTHAGKKVRRGAKVWTVRVPTLKSQLYGWLGLDRPTEESGEPFPPGYVHLPKIGDEFVKQLTAEQEVTKVIKGFAKVEWQKMRERNEALDCRVYAHAAAIVIGLDRFDERHWQEWEQRRGAAPRPAPRPQQQPQQQPAAVLPAHVAPAAAGRRVRNAGIRI